MCQQRKHKLHVFTPLSKASAFKRFDLLGLSARWFLLSSQQRWARTSRARPSGQTACGAATGFPCSPWGSDRVLPYPPGERPGPPTPLGGATGSPRAPRRPLQPHRARHKRCQLWIIALLLECQYVRVQEVLGWAEQTIAFNSKCFVLNQANF